MKRYFKYEEETGYGPGKNWITWTEWDGEWNTRQVEWYIDHWRCSLDPFQPGGGPSLSDKPLSSIPPGVHQEISQKEFEEAWDTAVAYRQQTSGRSEGNQR